MNIIEAEKLFREEYPNIDELPEHKEFLHDRITLAFRSGYNSYAKSFNNLLKGYASYVEDELETDI